MKHIIPGDSFWLTNCIDFHRVRHQKRPEIAGFSLLEFCTGFYTKRSNQIHQNPDNIFDRIPSWFIRFQTGLCRKRSGQLRLRHPFESGRTHYDHYLAQTTQHLIKIDIDISFSCIFSYEMHLTTQSIDLTNTQFLNYIDASPRYQMHMSVYIEISTMTLNYRKHLCIYVSIQLSVQNVII
jgi:hypothetical protein